MTLSPLVTKEVAKIRFQTLESDFNKIHNFKYDYSKVVYLNMKSNIKIICPIHGEFTQIAEGHLSGRGCIKCAGKYKPTLLEFIDVAKSVHKDKYDYSEFIYVNKDKVGVIKCNTCGNIFTQSPHNHVYHSKGCRVCNSIIKSQNPTRLYYVTFLFEGLLYYKIGKTIHSLKKRFGADMKNIVAYKSIMLSSGREAYGVEQHILNKFKEFRYEGEALIRGGNTEIFTVDIWEDIAEYFNGGGLAMAKVKTNKAPDEIISVGLYGNFKQGKHLSKFLGKVEVVGDCQTLQPFLCYNGLGGISKLHNINAGKCIKLQQVNIASSSYKYLLKHFNMVSLKVKTTIGLLEVPMQKSNDLDLTFINEGYYDGE